VAEMSKEMEYVYTVYQEGSFSKAAQKLYISQPALSTAVKKLENRLCAAIFDRSANPIKLTQAGEYYIQSIEKIMSIQKEMEDYFGQLAKSKTRRLAIGSSSYFIIYLLPGLIGEFQLTYPDVAVNFLEGGAPYLSKKLKYGEVDFVLDIENLSEQVFDEFVWDYENIVLVVPASFSVNVSLKNFCMTAADICDKRHLSPDKPGVKLKYFAEEPFIFLKKGNDLYQRGMALCGKSGFTPFIQMFLDQLLTCYYVACEGKGVTFIRDSLPQYVAKTDKVFFYKIDDELSRRAIKLFYRKDIPLNSAAFDFLDFMRKRSS
jgi:DNA-binding transcriptional LysR family regulator